MIIPGRRSFAFIDCSFVLLSVGLKTGGELAVLSRKSPKKQFYRLPGPASTKGKHLPSPSFVVYGNEATWRARPRPLARRERIAMKRQRAWVDQHGPASR
jgi:hypothetical protein